MRRVPAAIVCAALAAVLLAPALALAGPRLEIQTLSTRADKVTGGDVLARVVVPPGTALEAVAISLNGHVITDAFFPDATLHAVLGLVTGLRPGRNTLEAKAAGVGTDRLTLLNYPSSGPVFSGPQEKPFFCQTHQFRPYPNAPLLTAVQLTSDDCAVPTQVDYVYRTTANNFRALPPGPLPTDLVNTTTIEGKTVPYIVRVETGVINRAIYQTAILDDPSVPGPDLRAHDDQGWNGRLVYTFGGGCGGGHYIQGNGTGGTLNDMMLSRGFAVATASLNVLGTNCNDVLSAETVMMVKERFIESYGVPRYTMGWGCSGGGIQQYMITDNYPGLLDGLVPQCSFPDVYGQGTFDARLMLNYFLNSAGVPWTQDELKLASGFGTYGQIVTQGTSWAARIDPVPNRPGFPSALYDSIVPQDVRYDPQSNPTGARATTYDHNVNTFGKDKQGFARRPLDNVGVQYGLAALNAGQISIAQFLDLNEKIGGLDIDANFIPQRMVADERATRAAYQTGKVLNGGGGLAAVPILDFDLIYTDQSTVGDVHMKYYHFSTRERLIQANGDADNMVMWSGVTGARAGFGSLQAFLAMTAWLDAITADTAGGRPADRVVRNKPAGLTDGCWTGTTAPFSFVAEPQFLGVAGTSTCNTLYPGFGFPRQVAGMPLRNDIVKCKLKPIDLADYAVTLSADEQRTLREIFPAGVCDFTRPGVGQSGLLGTWMQYTDIGEYRSDE